MTKDELRLMHLIPTEIQCSIFMQDYCNRKPEALCVLVPNVTPTFTLCSRQ